MILVIAEQTNGKLNRASWEAIAAAQQLAGGSMPVKVAVAGQGVATVAAELSRAAVAEVITVEHAALAILRLSHQYAGELFLVALGPLTNLALALKLDPTLPQRVKRFLVMGGAVTCHGNITPAAEFNIAFDPEAAHVVFTGFPHIEVADWEATVAHGLLHADVEKWLAADTDKARFYELISRQTRLWSEDSRGERWFAADALAMAWALQPEGALRVESRPLNVELAGVHSRGATIVDWNRQTGQPDNTQLLMAYDQGRFEAQVRAALGV